MEVTVIVKNIYMHDELGPVVDTSSSSLEDYCSNNIPLKYFMTHVINKFMINEGYVLSGSSFEEYKYPWSDNTYTVRRQERPVCIKNVMYDKENNKYNSRRMLIKFNNDNIVKNKSINEIIYDVCLEGQTKWIEMRFIRLCYELVNMFNPNRMDTVAMMLPSLMDNTKYRTIGLSDKTIEYWKVFEEYDYSDTFSYFKKVDVKDLCNVANINPNILDVPSLCDRPFTILK